MGQQEGDLVRHRLRRRLGHRLRVKEAAGRRRCAPPPVGALYLLLLYLLWLYLLWLYVVPRLLQARAAVHDPELRAAADGEVPVRTWVQPGGACVSPACMCMWLQAVELTEKEAEERRVVGL